MKQNDEIYLKLHIEYKISKLNSVKFNNQRAKTFRVKKAHEQWIYKLKLFFTMKIHSMIFVFMLELALKIENFYRKFKEIK